MTTLQPTNPKPFLNNLTGKPVTCKLKWGMIYKVSYFSYMQFFALDVSLILYSISFMSYLDKIIERVDFLIIDEEISLFLNNLS